MADTIVHSAEKDAGDVVEPIVDLAKDAGRAAADIETHGEKLVEHTEKIGEHEESWRALETRVGRLETRITEIPQETGSLITSALEGLRSDVQAMVKSSMQTAESIEHGSETAPPHPAPNRAEKSGMLGGLKRALLRHL